MFLHSCRVFLYNRQTPCHNADLDNRSNMSTFAHRQATVLLCSCCYRMKISTCVSGAALAAVAVGELNAVVGASRVTWVGQTLVDVTFAALAYVACRTHTLITSDAVHALAVVEALGLVGQGVGGRSAVVQVNLTVDTYRRQ